MKICLFLQCFCFQQHGRNYLHLEPALAFQPTKPLYQWKTLHRIWLEFSSETGINRPGSDNHCNFRVPSFFCCDACRGIFLQLLFRSCFPNSFCGWISRVKYGPAHLKGCGQNLTYRFHNPPHSKLKYLAREKCNDFRLHLRRHEAYSARWDRI